LFNFLSSPICENKSVPFARKSVAYRGRLVPTGAARDRHGRGAGCGGRGNVARALALQGGFAVSDSEARWTNDVAADGEVVWS
jgi:hypothetical protein